MDRRLIIGGGIAAAAVAVFGLRMAMNTGAKTGLDDALNHLPPGFTASHGAVTYNGLTGEARLRDLLVMRDGVKLFAAGDVAVSGLGAPDTAGMPRQIGDIVLHDVSAGPYKNIDRIHLTRLNLENLRQLHDPAAYPGGKPAWTDKRPILEHADIHGVQGAQTTPGPRNSPPIETQFTIGSSTMDGVSAAQLPARPDLDGNPLVIIAALEARIAQESGSVKDIGFSVSGPAGAKGHIARITGGRYDSGRLDSAAIDDFAVTTSKPAGGIAFGGMTARGVDMSQFLAAFPSIVADPNKPHPELLNGMHLDTAELHGMRIDYPEGPLITIDSVNGGSPNAGTTLFAIQALKVQTSGRPLAPASRAALDSFGMSDFTTDVEEAGAYDPTSGMAVLKRCDIKFHDLGTLHLSFTLSGVAQSGVSTPAQIQAAIATVKLNAAVMTWDDASLVDRLLKMAAAKQGTTPDQVRASLAIPLASLPMLMPEQPDASQQVGAFLDGRHMLKISLNPPIPVGLMTWNATPAPEKAALLGVHVNGN